MDYQFEAEYHSQRMNAMIEAERAEIERSRPVYLVRPKFGRDGNQWYFLFGENLADGVVGFGDTPADAAKDFDSHWKNERIKT